MAKRRKQRLRPDEVIEEHKPATVLVAGGRSFGCFMRDGKLVVVKRERDFIYDVMNAICGYGEDGEPLPIILMHGACPTGVDRVVDKWAERNLIPVKRYPADWDKHGKAAGPIRNQQMVDKAPSYMIAFPGGAGTRDCARRADEAGIQVFIPRWGDD
jgi:hypothetical protein